MIIHMASTRSSTRNKCRSGLPLRTHFVATVAIASSLQFVLVLLSTQLLGAVMGDRIVIAPRHCHGSIRHLHLAVGNTPSASRSMTVSFASTWAFPDRVAPVAGVFVGTTPPPNYGEGDPQNESESASDASRDYIDFLANSEFYPEQEFPITYTILMDHKHPDSDLYHAPFQHHITIGGLEPDTTYYYLPVLGDREKGIDSLEEHARLHLTLSSTRDQLKEQEMQGHPQAVNLQSETKLTQEQKELIEREIPGNDRTRRTTARKQYFEYDESYLARDYDANSAIVEISQGTLLWDKNGRRLSPPPYDPTGIACIDAGKIRSFQTAPDDENPSREDLYPMHFGVIGDMGQFTHSQEVLNHLRDHKKGIRAVVLVGDIAYPEYDGRKWDTFFDFLDDHSNFDEIPLMVAAGNHGASKYSACNFVLLLYETRFLLFLFVFSQSKLICIGV
jgi:hypothetical protein